jgi:hypothetical protein
MILLGDAILLKESTIGIEEDCLNDFLDLLLEFLRDGISGNYRIDYCPHNIDDFFCSKISKVVGSYKESFSLFSSVSFMILNISRQA